MGLIMVVENRWGLGQLLSVTEFLESNLCLDVVYGVKISCFQKAKLVFTGGRGQ